MEPVIPFILFPVVAQIHCQTGICQNAQITGTGVITEDIRAFSAVDGRLDGISQVCNLESGTLDGDIGILLLKILDDGVYHFRSGTLCP